MAYQCELGNNECTGCGYCSEEAQVVYTCAACGKKIKEGEDYYEVFEEPFCEDCILCKTAWKV